MYEFRKSSEQILEILCTKIILSIFSHTAPNPKCALEQKITYITKNIGYSPVFTGLIIVFIFYINKITYYEMHDIS